MGQEILWLVLTGIDYEDCWLGYFTDLAIIDLKEGRF